MKGFDTWYVCVHCLVSLYLACWKTDRVYGGRRNRVESSPIRSFMSKVEVFRIAVFSKAGPVSLPDVWVLEYSYDDEETTNRVSKRLLV